MLTQGRSAWAGAAAGLLMLAFLVKRSLVAASPVARGSFARSQTSIGVARSGDRDCH